MRRESTNETILAAFSSLGTILGQVNRLTQRGNDPLMDRLRDELAPRDEEDDQQQQPHRSERRKPVRDEAFHMGVPALLVDAFADSVEDDLRLFRQGTLDDREGSGGVGVHPGTAIGLLIDSGELLADIGKAGLLIVENG